jgi:hypothetical protein
MNVNERTKALAQRIKHRFGLKYLAAQMGVTGSTAHAWLHENRDIFARMYALIDDLNRLGDDEGREISIELVRVFCEAVGRIPVPAPKSAVSFSCLMQAYTERGIGVARMEIAFSEMISDLVIEPHEIDRNLDMIGDQLERLLALKRRLKQLRRQCDATPDKRLHLVPQPNLLQQQIVA